MRETDIFVQLLGAYFVKTCNSVAHKFYLTPQDVTVILHIFVAIYTFLSIQLCYELKLINNTEAIKTTDASVCSDICQVI